MCRRGSVLGVCVGVRFSLLFMCMYVLSLVSVDS